MPFHSLHLDSLSPLRESNDYKFVSIIVDAFTKHCLLYPITRQDVIELKQVVTIAIALFGVPKLLATDRGRIF